MESSNKEEIYQGHDFQIISWVLFSISLICCIGIAQGLLFEDYTVEKNIYFSLILGTPVMMLFLFGIYYFSFKYNFTQDKLIVGRLFGLLGKTIYSWENLIKVEDIVSQNGNTETIKLYFMHKGKRHKISINSLQNNALNIKPFLFMYLKNISDLYEQKNSKFKTQVKKSESKIIYSEKTLKIVVMIIHLPFLFIFLDYLYIKSMETEPKYKHAEKSKSYLYRDSYNKIMEKGDYIIWERKQ